MRKVAFSIALLASVVSVQIGSAKAASILVGTCSGVLCDDFDVDVTQSALTAVGIGSKISFFAEQSGRGVVALGSLAFTFVDPFNNYQVFLPDFTGPINPPLPAILPIATVNAPQTFDVLTVTGLYFNQNASDTAAVELYLGPSAVPLPASAALFGAALISLAGFGYATNRRTSVACS